MKINVKIEIEIPEGATHYIGNIFDDPIWLKCSKIGVVGEHWWIWKSYGIWTFHSHKKPESCKEIDEIKI